MENKRESSAIFGVVVFLVVAIIFGVAWKVKEYKELSQSQVKYKDSTKDLVYSLEKEIESIDGENLTLKLPYVNISSSYADEVNKNISDMRLDAYADCNYLTYLNDNILSLVIEGTMYSNGSRVYSVYNIDVQTGDRIYNEDILEYLGVTEEKYISCLPAAYHNAFLEKFPNISDIYDDYTKSEEQQNTVADANCTIDMPMYMGLNKALKVIGKIYSPAGPLYYTEIVNVMQVEIQKQKKENRNKFKYAKVKG